MALLVPLVRVANLSGLNIYVNPLLQNQGDLIRAVNVVSDPYGAKTKRPGYVTFLGTADGSAVKDLWSWTKEDGSMYVYRASGTQVFSSLEGTGAWTATGNGSIAGTAHVGHAVLGNTMMIGDGVNPTRHTTNGTSFSDTTLAPVSSSFVQYQSRIYAAGTSSTLFKSTTNDATNWNTTGTSDSSSLTIPGEGRIRMIYKLADRVHAAKTSGLIYQHDGISLVDTATELGPSSPYSFDKTEDTGFWLNRLGIFSSNGGRPQLLSNDIQKQIYNDAGNGIAGTTFNTAPGGVHRYDYFLSAGTVTDDFTDAQVSNAILKYDFQKNEFLNFTFANFPTAYHSFKDTNGVQQLIFGDSGGQVYKYGGTAITDNGTTVESTMEYVLHMGNPEEEKEFRYFWAFFNPGASAKIQIAIEDTYIKGEKSWIDLGDARRGVVEYRFPSDVAGRLLFVKVYENSRNARYTFYGFAVDYDNKPRR